jgi:hypothetical protein
MSDVSVDVVVYSSNPIQEFTINMRGDTTLGSLRDTIHACIGGGRPFDRAWVAFDDQGRSLISFNHFETESDALQLRFLRCSNEPNSQVSVGVFRYSVPAEEATGVQVESYNTGPPNGQGTKRPAAEDTESFMRSGHARVRE